MIQLDFVLYRFVCDIASFTGLFAEDADGRCIPDTAAFHCTWSRTARSRQVATAVSERLGGSTDSIYFKALGADMALTFTTQTHQLFIDGEQEVVTFALRPSQYTADGPLPVIAKGTLDPAPYFDKPKKNYAIKLRDAAGQVTGKLLFSLVVHEVEREEAESGGRQGHNTSSSSPLHGRSPISLRGAGSVEDSRLALPRNPARDRLFKIAFGDSGSATGGSPPPQPLASTPRQRGSTAEHRQHAGTSTHGSTSPPRRSPAPAAEPEAEAHNAEQSSNGTSRRTASSVDVQLERVTVRSEGIDLEHPAPLLLGGDYTLKIRYGSFTYSTTRCLCCNPKELEYRGQQTCITLQPPSSAEKLRFSLWEAKKQVAGFSLDPAKFSAAPGVWKEYAIPFRYHPTGQKAALDVRVRRLVVAVDGAPVSRHSTTPPSHRQPTMVTGATEPIASPAESGVPRRLTYQHRSDDAVRAPPTQSTSTPLRTTAASPRDRPAAPLVRSGAPPPPPPSSSYPAGESPLAKRTGSSSPPGSTAGTRGFLQGGTTRDATPHRFYDATADRSMHTGVRSSNPESLVVRSGWERTPMQQRPPPLTQNLADLPADRRPPDDHEVYISEVLARLNRHPRGGPRQPTSLVEEWMGWRDDRERSRCNSVANSHARSNSISSVGSRADSVSSVVSRHASVPRATKSNAEHSFLMPYTPETYSVRRRYSSPSPVARNPLIEQI